MNQHADLVFNQVLFIPSTDLSKLFHRYQALEKVYENLKQTSDIQARYERAKMFAGLAAREVMVDTDKIAKYYYDAVELLESDNDITEKVESVLEEWNPHVRTVRGGRSMNPDQR